MTGSNSFDDQRRLAITNLKGIGISLVVFGHAISHETIAAHLIYSFHMPLFFIISGLLLKNDRISQPISEYVARQFRSLIVPFLFFSAVFLLVWTVLRELVRRGVISPPKTFGESQNWTVLEAAFNTLLGAGDYVRPVNVVLWFFTALFVTSIYFRLLRGVMPLTLVCFGSIVLAAIAIIARHSRADVLPWNIDLAAICLVFFSFGNLLAGTQSERRIWSLPDWQKGLYGTLLLLCGLVAGFFNQIVDLRTMELGYPPVFFASAILSCCGVLILAYILPGYWMVETVAANSIVIFPIHGIIMQVASVLARRRFLALVPGNVGDVLWALLMTVAAIACCCGLGILFRKYIPWAIGGR